MNFVSIGDTYKQKDEQKDIFCVGIDLGTTHSVVAFSHNQKVDVLPIGLKEKEFIPSILDENLSLIPTLQEKCFHNFKSFMETPYDKVFSPYTPEDLTEALCKHIKKLSEQFFQNNVQNAVITVPARFSDIARKATKLAAQKAGIHVIRLLNEPTAAALAYGLNHKAQGVYMVYDFGGGTFDVTLLRIQEGIFQVLATTGDLHLGGSVIDQDIVRFMGKDPKDPLLLRKACLLKEFYHDKNYSSEWDIPSNDFDEIVECSVGKTLLIVKKILSDVHMTPEKVQGVILVGGSTRLKKVTEDLSRIFGFSKILNTIDPDRAVAIGAALHAEALTHHALPNRPLLLDIIPASLGLETVMGYVENIIPKYTPAPVHVKMQFSTMYNNQTEILIHIVQGEGQKIEKCVSLGRFTLKNIPPMPKGQPKISVSLNVDEDGILTVEAREITCGVHQSLVIESYL